MKTINFEKDNAKAFENIILTLDKKTGLYTAHTCGALLKHAKGYKCPICYKITK